jgi:hypothetical protein
MLLAAGFAGTDNSFQCQGLCAAAPKNPSRLDVLDMSSTTPPRGSPPRGFGVRVLAGQTFRCKGQGLCATAPTNSSRLDVLDMSSTTSPGAPGATVALHVRMLLAAGFAETDNSFPAKVCALQRQRTRAGWTCFDVLDMNNTTSSPGARRPGASVSVLAETDNSFQAKVCALQRQRTRAGWTCLT